MTISRRELFMGLAGVGATAVLGCSSSKSPSRAKAAPITFAHGVASFDPTPDGVLLWTRVTGAADAVDLDYVIARDPQLRDVVRRDSVQSDPDADQTVVVDVDDLDAGTTYFYAFSGPGATTATARFRTMPTGRVDSMRLAVVSCSNYAYGFFAAYAEVAKRNDIDAVLHLGDYIYEYANGTFDDQSLGRVHEPTHEIVTLQDYRTRYAQYRRDPDLQELHRQHSMLCIWDDHEFANGAYLDGAENHQPEEGVWSDRRKAATQACLEWVPRRHDGNNIYRSVRMGDLADLVLLDTRMNGRDQQPSLLSASTDPGRQLLGATQEGWVKETLEKSVTDEVSWRIIGQQVMVAPITIHGQVVNVDQWDGYPKARARFVDLLEASGDCVVLTGDIHSSWALDIPRDPARYDARTGEGSACVEFVAPGVTSPIPLNTVRAVAEELVQLIPHVKWVDLDRHGFVVVDIERERVQADWYHFDDVRARDRQARVAASFLTRAGVHHLVEAPIALPSRSGPERAP